MGRKRLARALLAALVVVAPSVVGLAPATAAVGLTPLANFTSPTVVGQVAPAEFLITNNSDGAEAVGAVTVSSLTLTPSCGSSFPGCPSPDLNVFQLSGPFVGSGSPGAVCPTSYTVSVVNATTGEVQFTPGDGPIQLDVGESCRITFTTTTLRVPSLDASGATAGVQTAVLGTASGVAANTSGGGGFGSSFATVGQGTPTVATQAAPQQADVGQAFGDTATVTGAATGPVPTGTVVFDLYGPTSPGFPTCSGAPTATTAAMPLTGSGPNSATAASGTFGTAPPLPAGNYVFVATYSGDANYTAGTTACADAAEQVVVEALPTISVDKTASPLSRPQPGGTFTFTVVVTNTSAEAVTITSITDDVYGNLAGVGTCTAALGTVLAPSTTYTCAFDGAFGGAAGATQTDTVTVTAQDSSGNTASDTDDATVSITASTPTIVVDKTASPTSRPEPGGSFTFTVVVTNTSPDAVTITSLTDDVYGDLSAQGTCTTAVGTVIAPAGSYGCAFTGAFLGDAGASQTDVVTANAVDPFGSTVQDTDDAIVTITDVTPTIVVDKSPAPLSRPEPGGSFSFTVVVTNTSAESVTITALTDDVYGNLATQGSCTTAIGTVLAASGGTYTCTFSGVFSGNAGDSQTDVVTASAVDNDGSVATDTDDATVILTNVDPTVVVEKSATPVTRPEPGGSFTFGVLVTNTSVEPITIISLTDDVYGNIATQGTCTTAVGSLLAANGGTYTCTFPGSFTGNAGAAQTDVVTVTVTDDEEATAEDSDDATVTLTDAAPTITVDKTATPLTRLEPGGTFTFDMLVTNTSAEAVTITALTDDVYGDLATRGTCTTAVGSTLAANGGTYACSFTGSFISNAGASQTDVVTATVVDDEGTTGTDSDDATVSLTDVPPTITVDKTAAPLTRPEPGGNFTFLVVVTNTSNEAVTITSIVDDVYGDLATQGTCTSAIGSLLAASGGSFACTFSGAFLGNAGAGQTDVVTVTATDDDGTTAADSDDATVSLTDVPPTVMIGKSAAPASRPEPGGTFTFTVTVTNTSGEAVVITSLTDDVYGNLATQGTCTTAIGTALAANVGTYTCAFTGTFTGDAGASETDTATVIVTDNDGSTGTDDDEALVSITDAAPTIEVVKTPVQSSLPEPGGPVTFEVLVTNTSAEAVTLTALTDDVYGPLGTLGTCTTAVGTVLAANGGSYNCEFVGVFSGNALDTETDTVTAIVTDNEGTPGEDDDDATVTLTDVPPTVTLVKTATPATRPAPTGMFTFAVVTTNTSAEPVVVTSLVDDIYGDLDGQGSCPGIVGSTLAAGASAGCSFVGAFSGAPGDTQTDVVTVVVEDDDGGTATASDDAIVGLTPADTVGGADPGPSGPGTPTAPRPFPRTGSAIVDRAQVASLLVLLGLLLVAAPGAMRRRRSPEALPAT